MTDELKAMLKAAKTEEEAKEILLANKNELTDEETEKISGGFGAMIKGIHARPAAINFIFDNTFDGCTDD